MNSKISFDFEQAIKELFLGSKYSDAVRAMKFITGEVSAFNDQQVFDNSKSPIVAAMRSAHAAQGTSANQAADMHVLTMLYRARAAVAFSQKQENVNALQELLLTLRYVKDTKLVYEVLKAASNPATSIGKNAINMCAASEHATSHDLAQLVYISEPGNKAIIFADVEKLARKEIQYCLDQTIPVAATIQTISKTVIDCAKHVFAQDQKTYDRICQEYNADKLLTPNFKEFIPTMSNADQRSIKSLTAEAAELRKRAETAESMLGTANAELAEKKETVETLVNSLGAAKKDVDKYQSATATLIIAIKNMQASLFSRGVKAAQKKAKEVYASLHETQVQH